MLSRVFLAALLCALLSPGCTGDGGQDLARQCRELDAVAERLDNALKPLRMITGQLADNTARILNNRENLAKAVDHDNYRVAPSGVHYRVNPKDGSAAWMSGLHEATPEILEILYATEALDPVLKRVCQDNGAIVQAYYNDRRSLNRIYPPLDVLSQFQPGIDITQFNFYYLADQRHDPQRVPVWVDEPYLDPAGRGWTISAIAPVYLDDKLEGVVGVDATTASLTAAALGQKDNDILLADRSGVIIMGSDSALFHLYLAPRDERNYISTVQEDTHRLDDYSLLKSKSKAVRKAAQEILSQKKRMVTVEEGEDSFTLIASPVPELGWTLLKIIRPETG